MGEKTFKTRYELCRILNGVSKWVRFMNLRQ
jgi:hypothetical protein